jgi:hypothetical protein
MQETKFIAAQLCDAVDAHKACSETAGCLLPGSPRQALRIANQDTLVLQLDPAAVGEIA